jgi:thiol-disulfide isomerase/thioredoxin
MMEILLLAARLLLSGVFGVAGLAKLFDRAGSRQAFVDFGVPNALASPLSVLLPLAELAIAVALLPVATAWLGAIGALSLLLLFIAGISISLARGRTLNCHCFGQLSSSPAGWSTLIRNAILSVIAGFVVWSGSANLGGGAVGWFIKLSVAQRMLFIMGIIGLVLLAAEGWVLLQMLRQQGRLLLRLEALETRAAAEAGGPSPASLEVPDAPTVGLPVGSLAPAFRLAGLRGETLTLEALLAAGKPVMLLFTNPACGPCQALMPDIARWQKEYISALTVALISEGAADDNRAKSSRHGVTHVLLQRKREVAEAYQTYGTPGALVVQADGTIGSSVAMGAAAIRALLTQTIGETAPALMMAAPSVPQNGNGKDDADHTLPLKLGQPAPPLKVQDLKGKTVTLNNFRGRKTLLLFWNPGCGFCEQMLGHLKAWEAAPPPGAPKLLVISNGTVEENLAMNLRSTVVLDPNFDVGSAFEASGTPMAVLIDAKGRVASEVVGGAQAVLELAGVKPN